MFNKGGSEYLKVKTIKQDNLEIDYVNFGKKGQNLVIIPGLFSSVIDMKKQKYIFRKYYKDLAKHFNIYIFSKNKIICDDYSIESIANDQVKAMDLLNIKKTHLIGVSQGGMIAQSIAANNKDLIEKLVICVSTSKPNDETKKVINKWIELSRQKDLKNLVIDVLKKSVGKDVAKKIKKFYFILEKLNDKFNYEVLIANATSCINFDCLDKLNKIGCPVFIIAAKKDQVINFQDSILMSKAIKNSGMKIYGNVGHDIYSKSKEINKDILLFLKNN